MPEQERIVLSLVLDKADNNQNVSGKNREGEPKKFPRKAELF